MPAAVFSADKFTESIVIPSDSTLDFPSKGTGQVQLTFGFIGNCQDGSAVQAEGVEIQRIFRAIVVTFSMDQTETERSITTTGNCMLRLDAATRRIEGMIDLESAIDLF